jgi:hypothetical protein
MLITAVQAEIAKISDVSRSAGLLLMSETDL